MISWFKKVFESKAASHADETVPESLAESTREKREKTNLPWIGVDLDGTLADYSKWKGLDHVGKPIPRMQKRVMQWLEAGHKVKILTARASVPEGIEPVEKWLKAHGFPELEITNQKDFQMIELWDDRAIQVIRNTGMPVIRPSMSSNPQAPLFNDEVDGQTFEYVPVPKQNQ